MEREGYRAPGWSASGYLKIFEGSYGDGETRILAQEPVQNAKDARSGDKVVRVEYRLMQRIVNDLLAVAELDDPGELKFEPVNLRALVVRALTDLSPLAAGRSLTLVGADAAWVFADADKLELALRNLVQNAITATPDQGIIQIRVTEQIVDGRVQRVGERDQDSVPHINWGEIDDLHFLMRAVVSYQKLVPIGLMTEMCVLMIYAALVSDTRAGLSDNEDELFRDRGAAFRRQSR